VRDNRRTFRLCTNLGEVNHWAKVTNKTASINVQNRSLYAS